MTADDLIYAGSLFLGADTPPRPSLAVAESRPLPFDNGFFNSAVSCCRRLAYCAGSHNVSVDASVGSGVRRRHSQCWPETARRVLYERVGHQSEIVVKRTKNISAALAAALLICSFGSVPVHAWDCQEDVDDLREKIRDDKDRWSDKERREAREHLRKAELKRVNPMECREELIKARKALGLGDLDLRD